MPITDTGTIVEVSVETLGDELAADATAGTTMLTVADAVDFHDGGGTLNVGGTLDGNGVLSGGETVDYVDVDDEAGAITLATPLAAAYAVGDPVWLWPLSREKHAQVMVGDFDEAVQARVPHHYWDRIADGVRTGGGGETVLIELTAVDEFVIVDVLGSEPVVDGSYIDPVTMPVPAPVAPTISPTPEVVGTVGRLLVRLPPIENASSVVADIYVGTTSPLPLDATTLHGTAEGSLYSIETLPDGTPLAYGTTYYVVAVARNDAGTAPAAAEDSGQMRQVTTPDVAAEFVYAGTVTAGQVTSGTMDAEVVVGGVLESRGLAGERVGLSAADGFYSRGPVPPGGSPDEAPVYVHFPVDGKPNIVSGILEADSLTANDGATLRGASSVEPSGRVTLQQGVQPPKAAPAVVVGWQSVQHGLAGGSEHGSRAGLTLGADGLWYVARTDLEAIESWLPDGGFDETHSFDVGGGAGCWGVVYAAEHGGRFYVLQYNTLLSEWTLVSLDATTMQAVGFAAGLPADAENNDTITLGWDHTNARLLVAWVNGGTVKIQPWTMNADGSGSGGTVWQTPFGYSYDHDLGFVARGLFDYGVDRYVFRSRFRGRQDNPFQVFSTDLSPVQQFSQQWNLARAQLAGAWWDGTHFHQLDHDGVRYRYEGGRAMWDPGVSDRWSLAYSWYDSDAAGSGVHETPQGPRTSFTMTRRARVTMTTNAIPDTGGTDDPDSVRVYWGRGDTDATTAMAREVALPPGVTTFTMDPSAVAEGGSAAAAFGTAVPALVDAASGGFTVDGMSNGSVGAGTFRDSVRAEAKTAVGAIIDCGWASATSSGGNGIYVFSHNLGVVPDAVSFSVDNYGGTRQNFLLTDRTATTFSLQGRNALTDSIIGNGVTVAIRYIVAANR